MLLFSGGVSWQIGFYSLSVFRMDLVGSSSNESARLDCAIYQPISILNEKSRPIYRTALSHHPSVFYGEVINILPEVINILQSVLHSPSYITQCGCQQPSPMSLATCSTHSIPPSTSCAAQAACRDS